MDYRLFSGFCALSCECASHAIAVLTTKKCIHKLLGMNPDESCKSFPKISVNNFNALTHSFRGQWSSSEVQLEKKRLYMTTQPCGSESMWVEVFGGAELWVHNIFLWQLRCGFDWGACANDLGAWKKTGSVLSFVYYYHFGKSTRTFPKNEMILHF